MIAAAYSAEINNHVTIKVTESEDQDQGFFVHDDLFLKMILDFTNGNGQMPTEVDVGNILEHMEIKTMQRAILVAVGGINGGCQNAGFLFKNYLFWKFGFGIGC